MTGPLIGITTTGRSEEVLSTPYYESAFVVPTSYVDATRRAGGVPVLLPPGDTDWQRWLGMCDGFILTGGGDVAPVHYGGDPDHPRQEPERAERDATELALAQELLGGDTPALFVCRGVQIMNVAAGGTLHQHVADTLDEDMHRIDGEGWAYHDSDVVPGTKTAKAVGAGPSRAASGHHQAIDRLGANLVVAATATDGVIEAIEADSPTWLVGVQWHPEVTAADDPTQQGLFDALVAEAAARR